MPIHGGGAMVVRWLQVGVGGSRDEQGGYTVGRLLLYVLRLTEVDNARCPMKV